MNENIIFDFEKLKAMTHYIISKCEGNDDLIMTALYFSDFDNYEKHEKAISGETYMRKTARPFPSHFSEAINELLEECKIDESPKLLMNCIEYKYISLIEPDTSLLTSEELNTINNTINRICHFNSEETEQYSHGDIPLRLAKEDEALNYEAVFYRGNEYSVRDYN